MDVSEDEEAMLASELEKLGHVWLPKDKVCICSIGSCKCGADEFNLALKDARNMVVDKHIERRVKYKKNGHCGRCFDKEVKCQT